LVDYLLIVFYLLSFARQFLRDCLLANWLIWQRPKLFPLKHGSGGGDSAQRKKKNLRCVLRQAKWPM
jgi:hypothetical protein